MAGQGKDAATTGKKRPRTEAAERASTGPDLDMDDILGSDVKNILQTLQKIKAKSQFTNQKKNEEVLARIMKDVKDMTDEAKAKADKERQNMTRNLGKTCKEFEESLKAESSKFEATYKKLKSEQESHLQAYEDIFNKFEETKEKMVARLEQQRKKDKAMLTDLQKLCLEKIREAEATMTKAKKEASAMKALKKSLGSMFEAESDDEGEDDPLLSLNPQDDA